MSRGLFHNRLSESSGWHTHEARVRHWMRSIRGRLSSVAWLAGAVMALGALGASPYSVLNTVHNLSSGGPGTVRAASEEQVCIFCHTPHSATSAEPLWNRNLPTAAYQVYASSTLKAAPGQPTGTSKLCLSCHDGIIATGNVISRSAPITMSGGATTLTGVTNLGTDLRDDHPISFTYDATLVGKNPKLKNPTALPATVKLDRTGQLQCRTCHDPHNNTLGKFLVMDNSSSQLCNTCHIMGTTTVVDHVQCGNCHKSHTAPSGPFLLKAGKITDTCLLCHNGGATPPQGPNVGADLLKARKHDTSSTVAQFTPPDNVNCTDCHDGHTMTTTTATAPNLFGNFGKVAGITASGSAINPATYQYQVCFRCHADQRATLAPAVVARRIIQTNTRLEFDPSAISYHPVEAAGKNTTVPSLIAPLTVSSIIYCSDCHQSNTSKAAGGTGPNGTHGSVNAPLLIAPYNSTASTGLCLRCHSSTILNSSSSTFPRHSTHRSYPCTDCHDPHGISSTQGTVTNNAHLINFNTAVVTANGGILAWTQTSKGHGNCRLNCHGENHSGTGNYVY